MPISVNCPHCQNLIQFHESFASRVVACPTCAGQFQMPVAPAPSFQLPPLPTPNQPSGVPVINTGARPGRAVSAHRPKQNMLPVMLIGGAMGLAVFVVTCAGIASSMNGGGNDGGGGGQPTSGNGQRVTGDYLPYKRGARATYYSQMSFANDVVLEIHASFLDENSNWESLQSVGVWRNNKYEQVEYVREPLTKKDEKVRRVANGYVEIGSEDDDGWKWERKLKIGAVVGDQWTSSGHGNTLTKCRVQEFRLCPIEFDQRQHPSVIISEELQLNGQIILYAEVEYVQGFGMVNTDFYTVKNGVRESEPSGRIWLRQMNPQSQVLSSREQKFFE